MPRMTYAVTYNPQQEIIDLLFVLGQDGDFPLDELYEALVAQAAEPSRAWNERQGAFLQGFINRFDVLFSTLPDIPVQARIEREAVA